MSATKTTAPPGACTFTQLLPPTRRGARLARQLAVGRLRAWPVSPDVIERVELIVGELAANAALHGHVSGRDFRLALTLDAAAGPLRIAVTDAHGERLPELRAEAEPAADAESGRGLFLIAALADRWGVEPYQPGGKTVWAECSSS